MSYQTSLPPAFLCTEKEPSNIFDGVSLREEPSVPIQVYRMSPCDEFKEASKEDNDDSYNSVTLMNGKNDVEVKKAFGGLMSFRFLIVSLHGPL